MPENLYPKLPSAPSMSQESFNIETIRKYYQDITDLKNKYNEKQRKYKSAYNELLHASTGASPLGVNSGVSTIGTAFTVVGLPISAVIRCCEHRFDLCLWNFSVNFQKVQEEAIKVLRAVR